MRPTTIRPRRTTAAALAILLVANSLTAASPDRYNVVWDTPSEGPSGSMPLGNGDIGLNAWIESSGDLVFYISKTDAWSDNGRLLKVGRVRIKLDPAPTTDRNFNQSLSLNDATMSVLYGEGERGSVLRVWVDANQPVVHVTIDSPVPITATAAIELWRTEPYELPAIEVSDVMLDRSQPGQKHGPMVVEPDSVLHDQTGRIGWYHHNAKSVGPAITAKIQGLTDFERPDPLLHRTFGAIIMADRGIRLDDRHLQSPISKTHRISVYVLTRHPAKPQQWLDSLDQVMATVQEVPFDQRRAAHETWWRQFWDRSWIHVASNGSVTPRALIPNNAHPVQIGLDQHGHSRFAGQFGRISVFNAGLTEEWIRRLAVSDREQTPAFGTKPLVIDRPKEPRTLADSNQWDFSKGLTIEAWVQADKTSGTNGRIVDKITPGQGDGFLLDTWPGNSLRLIVGKNSLSQKDCLTPGAWHHVAAVVDAGEEHDRVQLWLDGRLVAEHKSAGGDDATVVSRAYALQRFIDACAGRGYYPIKFNGSIFTVPYSDRPGDADYRRWGPGYWWQNTRLPYLSMCASGDFEMMLPLFHMYADELMPLNVYRTKHYFGHDGAYIPECIYFWGDVFSETYGWTPFEERGEDKLQTSRWHKWEWVSGPELVWMMLDYYEHTLDKSFLQKRLLPAAHEVLTFFDQHYDVNEAGQLVMHPSQAVETWWDCTNPMPELAGLHAVTARLLKLPDSLTNERQRNFWKALRKKLPPLPTRETDGVRMLAPAERFEIKHNIENPELYAVFPFRLIALGRPDIELGIEALRHRWDRGHFGWRQDDIFMAYLGLVEDARTNLVTRARQYDKNSRFPAFWGPNYDWVPDQDHGGVLMKALQSMLMQTDGEKIFLLPAWPVDWDADFKLHAPYQTVVECQVRGGKVAELKVTPESRRKDVILPELR